MKAPFSKQRFVPFVSWRFVGAGSRGHLLGFLSRLAMLGLVLSVALLITVLSVMNGFDREMREKILAIVPHLSVYHFDGEIKDWQNLQKEFSNHSGVASVTPFSEQEGMLKAGKNAEAVYFYGVDKNFPLLLDELQDYVSLEQREMFLQSENGLLLGKNLASRLQVKQGDFVLLLMPVKSDSANNFAANKIISYGFQVSGIFQTNTEVDKTLVILPHEFFVEVVGQKNPSGLRVKLHDLFAVHQIQRELMIELPIEYFGRNWSRTHGTLYEAVQMSRAMVGMLMYVIIAVAVFNVVSTLVLAGFEKRQAIAILRVQGASRLRIVKLFLFQGLLIGLMGAGIGAVLGIVLSLALPEMVSLVESALGMQILKMDVYPIDYIPSDVRVLQVLGVALVAVLFSVVASIYPAWRASKVEPAAVLRYE